MARNLDPHMKIRIGRTVREKTGPVLIVLLSIEDSCALPEIGLRDPAEIWSAFGTCTRMPQKLALMHV